VHSVPETGSNDESSRDNTMTALRRSGTGSNFAVGVPHVGANNNGVCGWIENIQGPGPTTAQQQQKTTTATTSTTFSIVTRLFFCVLVKKKKKFFTGNM
jgi:hypothetical protein